MKCKANVDRRSASTDIRFTISPTVDCLREALLRERACETNRNEINRSLKMKEKFHTVMAKEFSRENLEFCLVQLIMPYFKT